MTPEEKQVIDEFEDSALEYEKTLAEKDCCLRGEENIIAIAWYVKMKNIVQFSGGKDSAAMPYFYWSVV